MVTGDGDGLSIGGNHFMHIIRRNVDVKILLFNNRIYGLTKGQYSPTSEQGKKTKSTPMGSPDNPIRPLSIAIAAEASFAARAIDIDMKHLEYVLERAAKHDGTAFVEIYQNCNIFNDGAFDYATDKETKSDTTLYLEHGKPLIFGKNGDKGIRLHGLKPEVVDLATCPKDDLLVHDEKGPSSLAFLLSRMRQPDFPEPLGVFRDVEQERYVGIVRAANRQGEGNARRRGYSETDHGNGDVDGGLNGLEIQMQPRLDSHCGMLNRKRGRAHFPSPQFFPQPTSTFSGTFNFIAVVISSRMIFASSSIASIGVSKTSSS